MQGLVAGYGRTLAAAFLAATALWAALLILAPQAGMLEAALLKPARQLDSAVAARVATDAGSCRSVLERMRDAAAADPSAGAGGGLATPSLSGGLGVPSLGGAPSANGGYVLQCERATTAQRLVRGPDEPPALLHEAYGVELAAVPSDAAIAERLAAADRVRAVATEAAARIRALEATASPYGLTNFEALVAARLIPMADADRAASRLDPLHRLQALLGLRYEENGAVFVRIGLVTLLMTLLYAAAATALALILCYPIAYNLALASGPRKAAWLLMALLVPYALVELMRVYAWLSLIENNGAFNRLLLGLNLVDAPVEFKRSPLTVFVVLVYTYILFMMFPLVNVLSTLDRAQIEAARDLGASVWRIHRRVVLPHARPGVAVGAIATFMLCAGAFSAPRIISRGLQSQWYAQTIYDKVFESGAVNVGAAYAFAFTVVCFVLIALFMWAMRARLSDFVRA